MQPAFLNNTCWDWWPPLNSHRPWGWDLGTRDYTPNSCHLARSEFITAGRVPWPLMHVRQFWSPDVVPVCETRALLICFCWHTATILAALVFLVPLTYHYWSFEAVRTCVSVVLGSLLKWSLRLCAGLVESSLDLTLCCLQIHLLSCTINIRHTWQLRSRVAFLPETNTLHILWWLRLKSFVLITNQPFPVLLAFHIPSLPSWWHHCKHM